MSSDDEKSLEEQKLLRKRLLDVLGIEAIVTNAKWVEIDGKYYRADKYRSGCLEVHVKSGIGGGWHPFKDANELMWVLQHYAPMKPPDGD